MIIENFILSKFQFITQENEGILALREATREIIRLVEEVSGIPVQVTEDPNLQTIASARMARRGILPQQLIVYKPVREETLDYLISKIQIISQKCIFLVQHYYPKLV